MEDSDGSVTLSNPQQAVMCILTSASFSDYVEQKFRIGEDGVNSLQALRSAFAFVNHQSTSASLPSAPFQDTLAPSQNPNYMSSAPALDQPLLEDNITPKSYDLPPSACQRFIADLERYKETRNQYGTYNVQRIKERYRWALGNGNPF